MNKVAISVLLPARDLSATLGECLDSIAAQDFHDYEIVVVDDHSGDDSLELLAARRKRDRRIRIFSNPGRGLVAALNHGLGKCRAPLVARMDADDRMHRERLGLQWRGMNDDPGLTLLASQAVLFPEERISAGYREYMRWQNGVLSEADVASEIFAESPFAHPTVMFRRSVVQAAGAYRNGPFPEDYELWLRLHRGGARMAKIARVLLEWRDSDGRASRTDPRYGREAFDALRARFLARDERLGRRPFVIWGAGRRTRQRCRHLLALGLTPEAWVDIDPRKIGNRLSGVPVVAPDWLQRNPRPLVLVYVANHGARAAIEAELLRMGYQRGSDWLFVG